jgi:uncharacterized DUF497 family protein
VKPLRAENNLWPLPAKNKINLSKHYGLRRHAIQASVWRFITVLPHFVSGIQRYSTLGYSIYGTFLLSIFFVQWAVLGKLMKLHLRVVGTTGMTCIVLI